MAKILMEPLKASEQSNVAPRAGVSLDVGMRTFGTSHFLSLKTKNLSSSGLLAVVENPRDGAPFQHKTLLEIVFYPDGSLLSEEIKVTAVVARAVASPEDSNAKFEFGVRFVDPPEALDRLISKRLAS
jgi:PilZ domain